MPSSKLLVAEGEYYHLYNRGLNKQNLFRDRRDYLRFLFLILYFQAPVNFFNLSRPVSSFVRSQTFNISEELEKQVLEERTVELNAFCLMPNHFHLLAQEIKEGGIAKFMQRVLTAYAKYFNTKYKRSGHVFESSYHLVHVEDNDQLLHLSAYIHKNPLDLKASYQDYFWSSFTDYTQANRWGKLLEPQLILEQFDFPSDYGDWVKECTAKDLVLEV